MEVKDIELIGDARAMGTDVEIRVLYSVSYFIDPTGKTDKEIIEEARMQFCEEQIDYDEIKMEVC